MKTKINPPPFMYFILMAGCLVLFTMCRKTDPVPAAAERIIAGNYYRNDTLRSSDAYTYHGDMITEILSSTPENGEDFRTEFQYSGNLLTLYTEFEKVNGTWSKGRATEITGYSGANPLELITHHYDGTGSDKYQTRSVYTYQGALLVNLETYSNYSGSWDPGRSVSYNYDNQGRILQEVDTNNAYGHISDYYYEAEQLTEVIIRSHIYGSLAYSGRRTNKYTGGLLTETVYYHWDSTAWVQHAATQYAYNGSGHLISFTGSGYPVDKFTYTYGDGSGNYRQLVGVTAREYCLPGDPLPFPVKARGAESKDVLSKGLVR